MKLITLIACSLSLSCLAHDYDEEELPPPTPKKFGIEVMVVKPIKLLFTTVPEEKAVVNVKAGYKMTENVAVVSSYTTKGSEIGAGLKFEF